MGFSLADTEIIITIIIDCFKKYAQNHDKIEIRGLGSFTIVPRKRREVNLGQRYISSPDHFGIVFRESRFLKKMINKSLDQYDRQEKE